MKNNFQSLVLGATLMASGFCGVEAEAADALSEVDRGPENAPTVVWYETPAVVWYETVMGLINAEPLEESVDLLSH